MSMVQQQQEIASELIAMARKSGVSEELISAVLRPVIPGPDGAPSATELIAMQDRQLRRLQDIIRAAERQKDPNLKTTGPVKMAAGYGIPQQVGAAPVTQAPVTQTGNTRIGWVPSKEELMMVLGMRLRIPSFNMAPFPHLDFHYTPEKVYVFVVANQGGAVILEDEPLLFPSDTLIAALRLLEG